MPTLTPLRKNINPPPTPFLTSIKSSALLADGRKVMRYDEGPTRPGTGAALEVSWSETPAHNTAQEEHEQK